MKLFQVTKKVEFLVYQLDIAKKWQIYLVFLIAQLEPCLPPNSDPFARLCLYNLDSVYVERDTDLIKSFKFK